MSITLYEHESQPFDWKDKHLAAVDRLRRKVGAEVLHCGVRGTTRIVEAAQHVGVVRIGGQSFEILPKIYARGAVGAQKRLQATCNLLYLLGYSSNLRIRHHDIAALVQRKDDWFEILTQLFAKHLAEEWQRGPQRGYQVLREDSTSLKGKWLLTAQLRRPERIHLFPVEYDEFTADNRLNRVLRYVVERLWVLSRDPDNRRLLSTLRQWMEEVTLPEEVTVFDATPDLVNRLNRRYEPILNLARLFLGGRVIDTASGDLNTFAFVFDMNRLFEDFVVGFISRHRDEVMPLYLEDCALLPQTRTRTLHLARAGATEVFRLKPDLAFCAGSGFHLLLDAKYKQLDPTHVALGVSQEDFYQMFAYAHTYSCARVLVVYPQTGSFENNEQRCFLLNGADSCVTAATIEIRGDMQSAEFSRGLKKRFREILTQGVDHGEH